MQETSGLGRSKSSARARGDSWDHHLSLYLKQCILTRFPFKYASHIHDHKVVDSKARAALVFISEKSKDFVLGAFFVVVDKVLVDEFAEMIGSIVDLAPEDAAFTAKTLSNSSHDDPVSRTWHQLEICTKMVAGALQAYSPLRLAAALSRNEAFDRYLSPG